jgi:hypothetical protein
LVAFNAVLRCNIVVAESPGFKRRGFVVMPFGTMEVLKKSLTGLPADPAPRDQALSVDFNGVFEKLFQPAWQEAGLQPFAPIAKRRPEIF